MRSGGKGRIRVNRDQAILLAASMSELRHRLVVRRADARDRGEDLTGYQSDIQHVTEIQAEVQRTIEEMGWLTDL